MDMRENIIFITCFTCPVFKWLTCRVLNVDTMRVFTLKVNIHKRAEAAGL